MSITKANRDCDKWLRYLAAVYGLNSGASATADCCGYERAFARFVNATKKKREMGMSVTAGH